MDGACWGYNGGPKSALFEDLGIALPDMLVGMLLDTENGPAEAVGYPGWIGACFADYSDPDQGESLLVEMIEDDELDLHNRSRAFEALYAILVTRSEAVSSRVVEVMRSDRQWPEPMQKLAEAIREWTACSSDVD